MAKEVHVTKSTTSFFRPDFVSKKPEPSTLVNELDSSGAPKDKIQELSADVIKVMNKLGMNVNTISPQTLGVILKVAENKNVEDLDATGKLLEAAAQKISTQATKPTDAAKHNEPSATESDASAAEIQPPSRPKFGMGGR